MIEAERETLSQTPAQAARKRRRGAPLAMLLTVAAVWIAGRAVLWENPYRVDDLLGQASTLLADRGEDFPSTAQSAALDQASIIAGEAREVTGIAQAFRATDPRFPNLGQYRAQGLASSTSYRPMGREHYALWRAALTSDPRGASWTSASRFDRPAPRSVVA